MGGGPVQEQLHPPLIDQRVERFVLPGCFKVLGIIGEDVVRGLLRPAFLRIALTPSEQLLSIRRLFIITKLIANDLTQFQMHQLQLSLAK